MAETRKRFNQDLHEGAVRLMHETASRSRRWPGTGICSGTLENLAVKGRRRREGMLGGQVLGAASERQRQDEPALGKQKETRSHTNH